jgi:hypothetical protein
MLTSESSYFDSPSSGVDEAIVGVFTKDHVVQDANTEELSCFAQAPGQFDVLLARRRISARMVVRQDDCRRVPCNCGLEDLAWLCCGSIYVV